MTSSSHGRAVARVTGLVAGILAIAGACDDGAPYVLRDPCWPGPSATGAPSELRCTGLYDDWESKRIAAGVRAFAPGTILWSDGADKQRWIHLPEGTSIDASNPDEWRFPIGTKAWKEFSLGGRRVETRLFHKVRGAAGDARWVRATYLWSEGGTRAQRTDRGVANFEGTGYSIPSTSECDKCHEGRQDRLLGFEAFGLGESGARGLDLATLVHERRLDGAAAPAQLPDSIPAPTRAALAWLHVNCGTSCHNRAADATANSAKLYLRLEAAQLARAAVEGAGVLDPIATTVGARARTGMWAGQVRVVPGQPDDRLLYRLASSRGPEQMPPILSHLPDPDGVRVLRAWIESLEVP